MQYTRYILGILLNHPTRDTILESPSWSVAELAASWMFAGGAFEVWKLQPRLCRQPISIHSRCFSEEPFQQVALGRDAAQQRWLEPGVRWGWAWAMRGNCLNLGRLPYFAKFFEHVWLPWRWGLLFSVNVCRSLISGCWPCIVTNRGRVHVAQKGISSMSLLGPLVVLRQYQLEHHLFPSMPRSKYPALQPILKKFADVNKVPGACAGLLVSWSRE